MGISTDAYLFYGFTFAEEGDELPWDNEAGEDDEYNDYFWSEIEPRLKNLGVAINTHCHAEVPYWFIAADDSFIRAYRGVPVEVTSALTTSPATLVLWDERIKNTCQELGIAWQQPSWWLASYADF